MWRRNLAEQASSRKVKFSFLRFYQESEFLETLIPPETTTFFNSSNSVLGIRRLSCLSTQDPLVRPSWSQRSNFFSVLYDKRSYSSAAKAIASTYTDSDISESEEILELIEKFNREENNTITDTSSSHEQPKKMVAGTCATKYYMSKRARHMVIPYRPILVPPLNWTWYNRGAYFLLPSYVMQTHGARQQCETIKRTPREQLQPMFEVSDTLENTKWGVNKKVLGVIDRIWANEGCFADLVDRENVVALFDQLKNVNGFEHSRVSSFLVCHILASNGRFKELRLVLEQMLQEEGSGSAPSLCDLLFNSFRGWKSNSVVWDMLAFIYSRLGMVHDALYVLAKMKDLDMKASIQTYNSLLYNLRHTDIMWDVYNEIIVSGTHQNLFTDSILIDGLCQQSRIQDAVLLLQETGKKESGPSVVSFNTIMSGYCKLGFAEVAKAFFCLMLKYGLVPDTYSYNILIHGLCMACSLEEALGFTNDMERNNAGPDMITYRILAKGFHLIGWMRGAHKVILNILNRDMNPALITYIVLICGHCQLGNVDDALRLHRQMLSQGFQLNDISYSVLLSSLSKNGRVDEALSLLYEMEATGLKPDIVTYSILIHGFCKLENVQKAIQLYNEMWSKGISPNSFAHSAILLGLCKNMVSEARMYFDNLTMNEKTQNIILYNVMIDGYVKHGNIAQAVEIYRQVIERRITPSIVTFNSLIYGFCKAGKIGEARSLLDNIKLHGLEPTAVTYTTLMDAYCEAGNLERLYELLQHMKAKFIEPTHVTYTVVIKGLCKQWKLLEAVQLLNDMYAIGLIPDQITYNTIIQSYCKCKDIRKAFQLVDEMLLHNLEPTPATYNVLISGLCLYGDLKEADNLLISLQQRNTNLTKVAYTTMIKAHCVKGDVNTAMVLFRQMVGKGFKISVRDYSAVINRLCKRCLVSEAKSFLSFMLSNGVHPDQEFYEVILHAFYQVGDSFSAFELVAKMIKSGLAPERFMTKR